MHLLNSVGGDVTIIISFHCWMPRRELSNVYLSGPSAFVDERCEETGLAELCAARVYIHSEVENG